MSAIMRIARIFPTKTGMSPIDDDAYFEPPGLFTPQYDEAHISCVFRWDLEHAAYLREQWRTHAKRVIIGGPACEDPGGEFTSGLYVRPGVVFTSRGCPNHCPWCLVPNREGPIRELKIHPGNIIQDNNLLACSAMHINKVFDMLKKQRAIEFRGGLETNLITPEVVDLLCGVRVKSIFIACDTPAKLESVSNALMILTKRGFKRKKIYCYVLCGKDIEEEEDRMERIFFMGAYPFAQLYQPPTRIEYSDKWKTFARRWSRPAIIGARMKNVEWDDE